MSKRDPLVFLVILALTVTVGCSGGDGGSGSTTPSTAGNGGGTVADGSGSGSFGTSVVRGVVTFEGAVPAAISIKLDADPYCVQQHGGGIKRADYVVGASEPCGGAGTSERVVRGGAVQGLGKRHGRGM